MIYMFYMENMFNIKNDSPAPAVDRALAILVLLSQSREPQGVSALARSLNIGKSSVHGILQALLAAGAIEDEGGRKFRLGPLVEELARHRRGQRDLSEICQPYLAELVEQTGQTSMFGVPEGDRFRIKTIVEGRGPFQVKAVQGGSIPLLAGVVGKIALAWKAVPMPEVLPSFTEDSIKDVSALGKELRQVRRNALALDRGEYLRGVYAVASPILRADQLVGILFSAGFQDQIGREGLKSLGEAVAHAARAITNKLSE
jgi:DNA-binding IclR family transcriptional regulator